MANVVCHDQRHFTFAPGQTALLMIDMQRDFFSTPAKAAALNEIIPPARRVLAAARNLGMLIFHTREGYGADGTDVNAYKRSLGYVGKPGPEGPLLIRGSRGHDFLDDFLPLPDETVVDKAGFSGFFGTDLHSRLQAHAVTHLLLAGVTTQCCVHSTLRDAVERGYFCLTLDDCCAAFDPAVHAATLQIIHAENNLFGWIADSAALLAAVADCQIPARTPK